MAHEAGGNIDFQTQTLSARQVPADNNVGFDHRTKNPLILSDGDFF